MEQLALKHNVLFTKKVIYLQDSSAAPPDANIIGVRGQENLYRMIKSIRDDKENRKSPAPASAPCVRDLALHNTFNHSSVKKLAWFQK